MSIATPFWVVVEKAFKKQLPNRNVVIASVASPLAAYDESPGATDAIATVNGQLVGSVAISNRPHQQIGSQQKQVYPGIR